MLSICILFISSSWLISIIVYSTAKLQPLENSGEVLINSDRVNRYLGVYIFSYIIRYSPFRFLNLGVYLKNNSIQELNRVYTEIRKAERNHLLAFLLVTVASSIFLLFNNPLTNFLYITISNILFNLYPALSLQLQKSRIFKMVRKQNNQGESKNIRS